MGLKRKRDAPGGRVRSDPCGVISELLLCCSVIQPNRVHALGNGIDATQVAGEPFATCAMCAPRVECMRRSVLGGGVGVAVRRGICPVRRSRPWAAAGRVWLPHPEQGDLHAAGCR